jgi:hypothetical protein
MARHHRVSGALKVFGVLTTFITGTIMAAIALLLAKVDPKAQESARAPYLDNGDLLHFGGPLEA